MVKDQMGDDSLILGTTRLPGRAGKPKRVEVVAAVETTRPGPAAPQSRRGAKLDVSDPEIAHLRKADKDLAVEIRQIESRLKELLDRILGPAEQPGESYAGMAGGKLLSAGFDPDLVRRRLPVERQASGCSIEAMVDDLVDRLRVEPPLEKISVFLGSSGSGKTTTILKIAAGVLLPMGLKPQVVYFGTDDGRSTTWLSTQCRKLRIRFRKVSDTKKMAKILRKAGKHPILIDTPGISDLTDAELGFIAEAAKTLEGMKIRLVVDSGMDPRNICAIASCVPMASQTSLVLTKLDEATSIGGALSMAIDTRTPLAYLTGGKELQTGIYAADASLISEKILESLNAVRQY